MLRINLLVALRTLLRHKSYSFINLFGLSIGIACCTLIYLYVDHELRHDAFHEKGERIYRLLLKDGSEKRTDTLLPGAMTRAISENAAGVSRVAAFLRSTARVRWSDSVLDEKIGLVSPDFLEVFSFPLLHGDPGTALEGRDAVVIGRSAAARLFGEHGAGLAGVIGRTITVLGRDHVVTGVVEDVPPASSLRFEYLLSYEHRSDFFLDRNPVGETSIFVELEEGTDIHRVENALTELIRTQLLALIQSGIPSSVPPEVLEEGLRQLSAHFTEERLGKYTIHLQPLGKMHFDLSVVSRYVAVESSTHAYLLSGMGVLVLLVACINFITLSIGGSVHRALEVGIRKVLGGQRKQLIQQFWGEALVLVFGAAVSGMAVTGMVSPAFAALAEKPLSISQLEGWRGPAFLLGMLLATGAAAGCYPAMVLSRPQAVAVLKGQQGRSRPRRFLQGMLVLQYGLAVGLIASAVMVTRQWDFLRTRELGFDREQIVVVPAPGEEVAMRFQVAANGLSSVVSTGASDRSFTSGSQSIGLDNPDGGTAQHVRVVHVDPGYLPTLGMELVAGRNFDAERAADAEGSAIINEHLANLLGWSDPLGRTLPVSKVNDAPQPTVIGVVKDFHFDPLHRGIQPLVLTQNPAYHGLYHVFVRIRSGAEKQVLGELEEAWSSVVPGDPFEWSFLDANLEAQYREEKRWTRIVGLSAAFVVAITCMGLLGQVTMAVARRTREIGIRKVLGATAAQVVKLMAAESTALLCLASAVSWPLSYLALQSWLEGFAYRIDLAPWVFVLATGVVMTLTLLLVALQSAGAALRSPADSLRYE
ncbi:MAG: ABC transporter permease [Gemmatimonadetes bacterium]|nr:ABC transporter permease [Gemmatimonadota bacterium]